ncbi:MAG: hypothetical protein DVB22_003239 [Verrucomicrobia bacterium]|nr:MAG: hypothetical protein DVB22_003239 [Verrucomicrobiota bacterium]
MRSTKSEIYATRCAAWAPLSNQAIVEWQNVRRTMLSSGMGAVGNRIEGRSAMRISALTTQFSQLRFVHLINTRVPQCRGQFKYLHSMTSI